MTALLKGLPHPQETPACGVPETVPAGGSGLLVFLFFVFVLFFIVVEVLVLLLVLEALRFFFFLVLLRLELLGKGERVDIGVAADFARGSTDLTVPPDEVFHLGFALKADEIVGSSHSVLRHRRIRSVLRRS
ncbi:MAG TPA: hypothetical protein PK435_06515 [Thermoanaerobaculaceae bacterium]|nr:hypothetical protein [Thermoanaerobaculaceae bacterium]